MLIVDAVTAALTEAFALAPRGTKAEIARRLGISPATVSKWAAGQVRPERDRWAELESILGLNAGTLLSAHERSVTQRPGADDDIPAAVRAAIRQLGDEIAQLRGELAELRDEVFAPPRSSDPARPTRPSSQSSVRT